MHYIRTDLWNLHWWRCSDNSQRRSIVKYEWNINNKRTISAQSHNYCKFIGTRPSWACASDPQLMGKKLAAPFKLQQQRPPLYTAWGKHRLVWPKGSCWCQCGKRTLFYTFNKEKTWTMLTSSLASVSCFCVYRPQHNVVTFLSFRIISALLSWRKLLKILWKHSMSQGKQGI